MIKFILSLVLTSAVFAQSHQLTFESISPEKGFSAPLIRGVLQDREGFLWFGALNGIYRYDGFTLKPYVYDPSKKVSITRGYVNVIYEDSKNNFWVGTSSGLNLFDRASGEYKQFVPDTAGHSFKNYIWSIFEDSRGTLWVGAMGLYTFDKKAGILKPVIFPKGFERLNSLSFQSIAEDRSGSLWFGTTIGLFKYNPQKNTFLPVFIDPDAHKLTVKNWNTGPYSMPAMFNDNSGFIWIGTYGGKMIKLDPVSGKMTEYPLIDDRTSKPVAIQSIAEENSGEFWLGTYSGLILFEKSSGRILSQYRYSENTEGGLSDDQIISVLKDKSGTLWAATLMGGLNRINRTTFPFNKIVMEGLMKDRSHSLVPYQDFFISKKTGSLFFGTFQSVAEIKPDLKTTVYHPPFKPVNVLIEDSRGNQWIGLKQIGGGELYMKDLSGRLFPVKDSSGSNFSKEVHCLYESPDGRIFFGTEFYLFEIDIHQRRAKLLYRFKSRIYTMSEDPDGNLIVGLLLGGMVIFDQDLKTPLKYFLNDEKDPETIIDNSITYIYKDKKDRIWVAGSYGFCLYNNAAGKFKRYGEQHGLGHTSVCCILEDEQGKLWMGTTSGISMFDPETETIKNYDKSYGMAEGYHYSAAKLNGKIFMKAKPGITYFDPGNVHDNSFIPPVKITEFRIFDKSYPLKDDIVLDHDQNYISFEFAALSFISPERNLYAYKMEGVDKDWIYPKDRRYAAYTNLKPGSYSFKVKASNNDGVWTQKETSLSIQVLPPWYQTYWAYGSYVIILIILVYGWRKYDLKRQNLKYQLKTEHEYSEKLEEISQMKSRFFTNISHEFRTPLTLIIGPAENIISGNEHDPVKEASMIRKNALRLLRLINQLLDISKLDEQKLSLKVSYGSLVLFTRSIVMIFESFAESKDIKLSIRTEKEDIYGYFDKEKLEKVLTNLISNAFKFTPSGGSITVSLSESGEFAVIKIRDTGIGISEEELPKLFDRFYQVDNSHTREYGGTGIGLSLTKDLVELHKGKISVSSRKGEWTEFVIELPVDKKYYDQEQISEITEITQGQNDQTALSSKEQIKADLSEALSSSLIPEHPESFDDNEEKMILLVVEDNADVREYIKGVLGDEFIIEEASNGEQAVRKAEKIIPDLIISDIMMPKMDGYEMTRILKNDEKTNHIPVILLTAKTERESKFEGLETGADDYLTKPFDNTELLLRVRNLINIRRTLQEKFSGNGKYSIKDAVKKLNPLNEKFMSRVNEIITKNLDKEEFSIEDFGFEAGMSRTQLHRKLKALTGKSASRYLRSFRLSIARKMIEQQEGNISEIAYNVGFSSPTYFSKCFKEEYGYSPSDLKPIHEE